MPDSQPVARYPVGPGGVIRHWLACGPLTTPLDNLPTLVNAAGSPFGRGGRWVITFWPWHDQSKTLKLRAYQQRNVPAWQPDDPPALGAPGPGGAGRWNYATVEADQVVDFSLFNLSPTVMQAWLYVGLHAPAALTVEAELLSVGPCHVWLNGERVHQYEHAFGYVKPATVPVRFTLRPGTNDLWLHGTMIGWREARLALGMRLLNGAPVSLRVPLGEVPAERWQRAEQMLTGLQLRQFAFPDLPAYLWRDPDSEPDAFEAAIAIPLPAGAPAIFQNELGKQATNELPMLALPEARATLCPAPDEAADLPITPELLRALTHLPGEQNLRLTLRPTDGTPFVVEHELWASHNTFSQQPYGDYASRRRELLAHLAAMPYDVQGAMAAVATGRATTVDSRAVAFACHYMENRYDCADFYAVSLLALLFWFSEQPALRDDDRQRIEAAFTGFKFWIDEPGIDAMCYFTENHQILFHTAAYLVGQRWPERVFANSGLTGSQQRQRARRRIDTWILARLAGGFSEWDSNTYLSLDAFALLALVEFSASPRLREMATALLHKLFFALACQSWRGVHGSSHGRCYVDALKSARVELTSGMQRLAWGMGIFNGETRPTGLLALARRYRLPEVLQRIGADLPARQITRAQSAGRYRPQFDLERGDWAVNTLTYRTPDGMIAAAVDYRPGEVGIQEHLWQATLGPEAVVFTTWPGNAQQHGNARPNYWAGSARLPRVGMIGRTVLCLYDLSLAGGLDFTHAYFPTAAFDDWHVDGPWAFARKRSGYVALWGDGDLALTTRGRHAWQELRSDGAGQVWLCHLGRAAEDGDFGTFCQRTREHAPAVDGLSVRWTLPTSQAVTFGWSGPLLVDGQPLELADFPHYDNDYTHTPLGAEQMIIEHGGQRLTLNLAHGRILDNTGTGA